MTPVSPSLDPKAWAYALRDREAAGESLTSAQRAMWRAALETVRDFKRDEARTTEEGR